MYTAVIWFEGKPIEEECVAEALRVSGRPPLLKLFRVTTAAKRRRRHRGVSQRGHPFAETKLIAGFDDDGEEDTEKDRGGESHASRAYSAAAFRRAARDGPSAPPATDVQHHALAVDVSDLQARTGGTWRLFKGRPRSTPGKTALLLRPAVGRSG